jgi:hypothetical protein
MIDSIVLSARILGCASRALWRESRLGASLLIAAALSLSAYGCTDKTFQPVIISSVEVAPPTATVVVGDQVTLTVTILDDRGVVVNASPTWSTETPSVATVDSTGVARGVSEGSAVIRATYGDQTGTATVRVVPGPGLEPSTSTVTMVSGAGGPPPAPVTVHIGNSGTGTLDGLATRIEYTAGSPGWLSATLAGTTAPTSMTLTASTAALAAGVRSAKVAVSSTVPDVSPVEVVVTLTLAGFTLTQTGGGTVVSETGSRDTVMVSLQTQPTKAVVFSVTRDATEVNAPSTLTIEPDQWNVPRAIALIGVDDFIDDGDQVSDLTISVVTATSDEGYAAIPPKKIAVTTIDNDEPPGLIITESGNTRVGEDGSTDEFTVRLTTQPATDVVLTISSGDQGEVRALPPTLTFGRNNWNVPQTVTVTGVQDSADDGNQVTPIRIEVVAVVSDDAFDAVPPSIVSVTTTDDDEPAGLAVEETDGHTTVREGTTDVFTVALTSQPATNVVLLITSANTGAVIVTPPTLTFGPGNWDDPQTVIVRGVDDDAQVTDVTIAVLDVVSDDAYDGVPPYVVSVTTDD